MKTVELKYSRRQVNKAGDIFRDSDSSHENNLWAADVLSNWRAIHNYPITMFSARAANDATSVVFPVPPFPLMIVICLIIPP